MKWTKLLETRVEEGFGGAGKLLNQVDEDRLDWRPETGENWMTTGQLILHLTNACGYCMKGFVTGDWGLPEGEEPGDPEGGDGDGEGEAQPPAESMASAESIAQVRELMAKDRELSLAMIAEAGEETLESKVFAAPWGGPEKSLGQHLLDMVQHLDQHKGQLFYYLKLQGKPVNTMHLWGLA